MTWARLLRRIELKVLSLISPRRSFLCDSHPWLCIHCKMLREKLKGRRLPNLIMVFTNKGPFLWTSVKGLKVIIR